MPARPHNAISGILAGGILGFGIATFLLWHPSAHPVMFLCFLLLFPTDGLLGTWHTSCLVTPLLTAACYDASIPGPLIFSWLLVFVCLFVCFACFLWLVCVFVRLFVVVAWSLSLHQWNIIIQLLHYEHRKLTTVLASLAVISTTSKHLHNDLAKAIEALEQKKEWFRFPRHSVSGSTLLGLTWDSWCERVPPRGAWFVLWRCPSPSLLFGVRPSLPVWSFSLLSCLFPFSVGGRNLNRAMDWTALQRASLALSSGALCSSS